MVNPLPLRFLTGQTSFFTHAVFPRGKACYRFSSFGECSQRWAVPLLSIADADEVVEVDNVVFEKTVGVLLRDEQRETYTAL